MAFSSAAASSLLRRASAALTRRTVHAPPHSSSAAARFRPPPFPTAAAFFSSSPRAFGAGDDLLAKASHAEATTAEDNDAGIMANRLKLTLEVTVSKLLPAGFGWQAASVYAEESLGAAPDTVTFALATGVGDALAVFLGHTIFYTLKSSIDDSIKVSDTVQVGAWLATATLFSGTVWQPTVNALETAFAAGSGFPAVFTGVGAVCGFAFYTGLRVGRKILAPIFPAVPARDYDNLKRDAGLGIAIGGASAFFVGTDAGYLDGKGNFLYDIVAVTDACSTLNGCCLAGLSTGLGFFTIQMVQNVVLSKGKHWMD